MLGAQLVGCSVNSTSAWQHMKKQKSFLQTKIFLAICCFFFTLSQNFTSKCQVQGVRLELHKWGGLIRAVGTVTRPYAESRRIEVRFLSRTWGFSVSKVSCPAMNPLSLLFNRYRKRFLRSYRGQEVKLTIPPFNSEGKNEWSHNVSYPHSFLGCRDKFTS